MQSIFDQGPFAPCPRPFNLAQHVLGHAGDLGGKTALTIRNGSKYENWTYSELSCLVDDFANRLLSQNIGNGAILVMRIGNSLIFPAIYLAAIKIGAVPVPTSPMLTDVEFTRVVKSLDPSAILHDGQLSLPAINTQVLMFSETPKAADAPKVSPHLGDPDRLGYIVYTSGTSGNPTAVAHAHRAIWARQIMIKDWYDLTPDDRLLHAGAFNWTFTLGTGLMDPWTVGATSIVTDAATEIVDLPEIMRDQDITIFAAAPSVYRKLLKQKAKLANLGLRHGLCAGESLSDDLRKAWQDATGCDVIEAFGMSECSTFISGSPRAPSPKGTIGRPQMGRRVAIINGDTPAPIGTPGEIAVNRSDPGLMIGYYNDQPASEAKFRGEWFLTGDLGTMDRDGNITYLGRNDDMMNAGGYRVSPLEVETALSDHPGIEHLGVTDVTVSQDARVIAAFYTSASEISEDSLKRFANDRLARYKQPRIYQRLDVLPTNANGKLSRKLLRQSFEAQNDRIRKT
jgi:acyl-coenzyme A synthetase/AMP-(fatty) acid ligase